MAMQAAASDLTASEFLPFANEEHSKVADLISSESCEFENIVGNFINQESLKFCKNLCVKEIVDVSFSPENGNRIYKVQWEETWEREDELILACKNLITEFWRQKKGDLVKSSRRKQTKKKDECPNNNILSHQNSVESFNNILTSLQELPFKENTNTEELQPKTSQDLPDHYKHVAFAKSIRENFSKEVSSVKTDHDYVEEIMKKKLNKKTKINDKVRLKRDESQLISYKNKSRVECEVCFETFCDQKSLLRHKISRHQKYSPHQCPICQKMFHKPSEMRRHFPTHSKLRAYDCYLCDKTYKTNRHLRRHLRIKHPLEDSTSTFTDDIMQQLIDSSAVVETTQQLTQSNDLIEMLQMDGQPDENISITNNENSVDTSSSSLPIETISLNSSSNFNNTLDVSEVPSETSKVLLKPQEEFKGTVLTDAETLSTSLPLCDQLNNPTETILHSVPLNTSNVIIQDGTHMLNNTCVILSNQEILDNFYTRPDTFQMCLTESNTQHFLVKDFAPFL